jgi:uncharacterized membrane protein
MKFETSLMAYLLPSLSYFVTAAAAEAAAAAAAVVVVVVVVYLFSRRYDALYDVFTEGKGNLAGTAAHGMGPF